MSNSNKEKITHLYLNGDMSDDELVGYVSTNQISIYEARQLKCRKGVMNNVTKQ